MKYLINLTLALFLTSTSNGQSEQTINDGLKYELKEIVTTYAETAYRGKDLRTNRLLQKHFDERYLEIKYNSHQRASKNINTPDYEINIIDEFFSTKKIKDRGIAAIYAAQIEWKGFYIEVALSKNFEEKVSFFEGFVNEISYYPTDPNAENQTEEYVGKAWDDLILKIKKLGFQ
ncbi:MAG: hypothetical protein ABJF11_20285 [Reichenbachiella sp.]|uniref:hypothetical protein n=1 Tax=Reichenbachiella sp. TaxID=2184521 RepID=UPI003267F986